MTTRERPVDRGIRLATRDRVRAGMEIRDARIAAGISVRAVAHAAGMSPSHAARIERGVHRAASVEQLARLAATVGLDARLRLYPGPDPIRDRGHVALLERLRARLSPRARLLTEVPIPIPGDPRALDGVIDRLEAGASLPVEAETRLADAQAQTRRLMLKVRDAGFDELLLIVADTQRNRDAVRAAAPSLRDLFPIAPRVALARLAKGRHPGASALLFL